MANPSSPMDGARMHKAKRTERKLSRPPDIFDF